MQTADPDSLGFVPERLAHIPQFLRERYLDSGRLKGFQLLIGREDEVAHFSSHGKMYEEDDRELPDDAIFR
ncbi:MAG: serine hydrolase, partial [Sphingomonadales bacterium]|nr:serine hydrolase [Sphingomonadales bacterium]